MTELAAVVQLQCAHLIELFRQTQFVR